MTTDDILRMAREAGFHAETVFMTGHEPLHFVEPVSANSFAALERFFRLAYAAGAEAEREACAEVCGAISDEYHRREGFKYPELKTDAETGASDCETAIRARERNERHSNNEV